MQIVNWSFITSNKFYVDHLESTKSLLPEKYNPFTSLTKEIINSRKGIDYIKCPAHTDFLKNTFVFRAPFDLNIDIEISNDGNNFRVFCENINQEIFDSIIDIRFLDKLKKNSNLFPLIGIDWLLVFTAEHSIKLQVMPAFMHTNDFTNKTVIIPGEYDVSKWTRPIETVFEIKNKKEKIIIKQGDALYYVKFLCDDVIKLKQQSTPWDEIVTCNNIRSADKFKSLEKRYSALKEKRASACPFHIEKSINIEQ